MQNPPIILEVNVLPIMDIPRGSRLTNFPTQVNIFPSSRAISFIGHSLGVVVTFENPDPEAIRLLIQSLG